ncbi:MAG: hypothetical protein CMO74_05950 [Verrucomicrobiales bacterium]|nr:hypothetical protein [Verrucomicrobiales bacterium]
MVINTNIEAQATANNLNASQLQLAKSLSRLSSGSKIIVPSDDAAGLAVSSRLNSQIKRLDSALNNVVNAVSFTQTQDGFMKTIDKAFRRMGELAMLAQDTTKSDEDRALYNQEFAQLKDYVSETTKQDFNGVSLFGGKTLDVTVDADGTTFTMVGINLEDPTYTSATNTGTDAWRLTKDAHMLSKDGYKATADVYKTTIDLWRDISGNWSASDNGGIKVVSGSYVSEDVSTANTAATKITKDNFIAGATVAAGFKTDYATNRLNKTDHGMANGDAITFHSNAPGGTNTTTTYYVNSYDTNNITLHASKSDAVAATNAINLTRSGSTSAVTGISVGDSVGVKSAAGASMSNASATITKTGHGLVDGDKIKLGTAVAPANTTTDYYVKKIDDNSFKIYNTLANATAAGAGGLVTFSANGTSTVTAYSDNAFTKAAHGYTTGDQVVFTSNPPAGASANTAYYVKVIDADNFTVFDTATNAAAAGGTGSTNSGQVNITASTSGLSLESNMKTGGNINQSTDVVTMTAHGLSNGTQVKVTTNAGGHTVNNTAYYVKKLDANTFELYTDSNLTTKYTGFTSAVSNQSFRLAVEVSSSRVAINDQGSELKKGMFLTSNPILTGEDKDAVLAKTGEVVNIAKTTQDISAFANELGDDYDDVNLRSVAAAQTALGLVKSAITQVATDRAKLGAVQSRLNFTNEQLTVTKENLSAAISRIADVDVAEEATNYARYQILVASGTEMLKQANQLPQSALQLLR